MVKILILTFLICLCGCGQKETTKLLGEESVDDSNIEFFLSVSEDDILIENSKSPCVKIDTLGYEKDDKKTVYFEFGKSNSEFHVVDVATREVVFSGKLDRNRTGDFTAVDKAGTYYIEAEKIGRSKEFSIVDNRYESLKDDLYHKALALANSEDADFEQRLNILSWIFNYQIIYGEKDNIIKKDYTQYENVLAMLKAEAAEYKEKPEEHMDILCRYGALMANAYYVIAEYDEAGVHTYLNESVECFDFAEKEKDAVSDKAYRFLLAASLYRANGQASCKTVTEKYLEDYSDRFLFLNNESIDEIKADEAYVHGTVIYLNTTNPVNLNLCSKAMKTIMKSAERFDGDVKDDGYRSVSEDHRNRMLSDRLYVIAIVEHVIVSKEYHNILMDAIHYLGGCNQSGSSFICEGGIYDSSVDEANTDAELAAAYYYILGEVLEGKELEKMSMSSDNLEDDEEIDEEIVDGEGIEDDDSDLEADSEQ